MEIQALANGCSEYLFGQVDPRTPAVSLNESGALLSPGGQACTSAHTLVICT